MKKIWLLIAVLIGLFAGLVLSAEWRAKLSEPLAAVIGRMVANMPDE